ncbi:MAG: ATP phosphoribosyltransferase regulatory subunit [Cyanobacteria bacterium Co-bin8]|nr:ATP phosphoribosyltransferase regulatory subunit [Cyanobacteria bacterium Co-bin8]
MVYQPPAGTKDLLPLDVAQKYWIEERLEQVFQRWGYHRIMTSTVERMDTLMAGGAIDQTTVIELQPGSEERLGLRPELTASIARTAVTRLARVTYPQRLYYNANVFRRADKGSQGGQQEFYQCGVELLGARGDLADAEILLLLADSLTALNLSDWHLILGDAGLTQSLLSPFPDEVREQVRAAIAHLDRITLESLPLPPDLQQRALRLMDLRGKPEDVLQSVSSLGLTLEQQETVNRLKSLIALLREVTQVPGQATSTLPALTLDLSLIQTFDYYTGVVFEVVSRTSTGFQVLGRGGRYDNLLSVFHPQGQGYPGIGFMWSLEALHQVLLAGGQLPEETAPSEWLIVPTTAQAVAAAFTYAQKIRASASLVRVEVHLDTASDPEQIRAVARLRRISRIAWIEADGLPEIESLN